MREPECDQAVTSGDGQPPAKDGAGVTELFHALHPESVFARNRIDHGFEPTIEAVQHKQGRVREETTFASRDRVSDFTDEADMPARSLKRRPVERKRANVLAGRRVHGDKTLDKNVYAILTAV
jgi:hypothetical protein